MQSLSVRLARTLEGRTSLSYERAFLGVAAISLVAFSASYRALLPLASSESATAVALIVPFAGIAVLFASMRNGVHVTEEVSVNVMLASPLLLALAVEASMRETVRASTSASSALRAPFAAEGRM